MQDYLPAWRASRKEQLVNAILAGNSPVGDQQVIRGQMMMALAIEELDLTALRYFYDLPGSAP